MMPNRNEPKNKCGSYSHCPLFLSNVSSARQRRRLPEVAATHLFIADATTYHNSSVGMDKASRTLAEGVPPGVPFSFRALADYKEVPHSTAYYRSQGRRSLEQKAQD
jgi:hypothetical protein